MKKADFCPCAMAGSIMCLLSHRSWATNRVAVYNKASNMILNQPILF